MLFMEELRIIEEPLFVKKKLVFSSIWKVLDWKLALKQARNILKSNFWDKRDLVYPLDTISLTFKVRGGPLPSTF